MNALNIPAFGLLAALLLAGCEGDKVTGTMDESNQTASARILMPGGKLPAAGAVVQVWRPDDTTKIPVAQVITGADGSYSLPTINDGVYRLVARKASEQLVSMQDSIYTAGGHLQVQNDTLGKAGMATGYVKMVGDDNPGSVTIVVMGTDVLLNVDRDGKFQIDNLASGTYRLRLSTALLEYTTTQVSVKLDFSKAVVLDTIVMNYAGIPPVNRFVALFDSLSQRVKLLWSMPYLRGVRDVQIFREDKNQLYSPQLVGVSDSGVFWDDPRPSQATTWLYTAKIRQNDGAVGRAAWTAVAQPIWKDRWSGPTSVLSFASGTLCRDSVRWRVMAGDTICLVGQISMGIASRFQWSIEGGVGGLKTGVIVRSEDTGAVLRFKERVVVDSAASEIVGRLKFLGDSDAVWQDSLRVGANPEIITL